MANPQGIPSSDRLILSWREPLARRDAHESLYSKAVGWSLGLREAREALDRARRLTSPRFGKSIDFETFLYAADHELASLGLPDRRTKKLIARASETSEIRAAFRESRDRGLNPRDVEELRSMNERSARRLEGQVAHQIETILLSAVQADPTPPEFLWVERAMSMVERPGIRPVKHIELFIELAEERDRLGQKQTNFPFEDTGLSASGLLELGERFGDPADVFSTHLGGIGSRSSGEGAQTFFGPNDAARFEAAMRDRWLTQAAQAVTPAAAVANIADEFGGSENAVGTEVDDAETRLFVKLAELSEDLKHSFLDLNDVAVRSEVIRLLVRGLRSPTEQYERACNRAASKSAFKGEGPPESLEDLFANSQSVFEAAAAEAAGDPFKTVESVGKRLIASMADSFRNELVAQSRTEVLLSQSGASR